MNNEQYLELTNRVLGVNYWGELLTVELISGLLRRDVAHDFRRILARQLMDETRHANVTRHLMMSRGRDPVRDDSAVEFTYQQLFADWCGRAFEEVLVLLGTNERSSSRNFASLIKTGHSEGDEELVTLYAEVLNDEVHHSHNIFDHLVMTPELKGVQRDAQAAMKKGFSLQYGRLAMTYPQAFRWKAASAQA